VYSNPSLNLISRSFFLALHSFPRFPLNLASSMTTELSITGVLPSDLYTAAISRLSNFSETGESFSLGEQVYARAGTPLETVDVLGASAGQFLRVKALRRKSVRGGDEAEWLVPRLLASFSKELTRLRLGRFRSTSAPNRCEPHLERCSSGSSSSRWKMEAIPGRWSMRWGSGALLSSRAFHRGELSRVFETASRFSRLFNAAFVSGEERRLLRFHSCLRCVPPSHHSLTGFT
jgi:hypothetical protein